MSINYPQNVVTDMEKLEFCYIAQESLRFEHNLKGEEFNKGQITKTEWDNYKAGRFNDKQEEIIKEQTRLKEGFKRSTAFDVDLDAHIT